MCVCERLWGTTAPSCTWGHGPVGCMVRPGGHLGTPILTHTWLLQSVPGGGFSFLGKPGQLGPLARTALLPRVKVKVSRNIDWRCPPKSSNLGTIKGRSVMRKSLTQADSGGQCTLGAGRRGHCPLEGKFCRAQGQRCPRVGLGLGWR